MQSVSGETRRAIWETQMIYDAAVFLIDGKTRQFAGASREISAMQRVDTDDNRHLRGDNHFVRVPTISGKMITEMRVADLFFELLKKTQYS